MYLLSDPFEGNESVESQFGFTTEARDCDRLEPANNDCLVDELYRTSEKESSAAPSAERRIKPSLRVSAESELARYVQRGSLVLTPNAHNSLSPEALSAKQFQERRGSSRRAAYFALARGTNRRHFCRMRQGSRWKIKRR